MRPRAETTPAAIARAALLVGLVGLVGACDGRPRAGAGKESPAPKPRSGPAVLVFDLSSGVPEEEKAQLLVASKKRSFDQLVQALDNAGKDKDAKAFFVRFGGASIGMARAEELGGELAALRKSGAPVVCHADGFTNSTILAAARGCSRLVVSPAGEVETIGIAAQIVYMRKLLADELKVSIDFLQIGKFKGAEEPFTRDGPSDEARASLESTLADMRAGWLDGVKQGRASLANAEVLEDGPYAPPRAKELGLIDEIGYADDALADLKKSAAAPREDVRFGAGAQDKPDELGDLVRTLAGAGSAPVALVRASGSISMAGGGGLLGGRGGITEHDLSRVLLKVERDADIKVLVLRIDSPGGSALASDHLWHDLMRIRKKKPIVVSVGDMAASGGYYLASTGSVIYADAGSIVGSIGVVGGKLAVGGALERFGLHTETFTGKGRGDVKAANRAAYLSPLVAWDEPTRVRVRETMTGIYDLFLQRVSEGRSTEGRSVTAHKVAESAEGRIFSGREGKARGLVDEIGGLSAALARARKLASLPDDAGVQVVGAKASFLDALDPTGSDSEERAAALARAQQAAPGSPMSALEDAAPDVAPFAASLLPLAEGERAAVAVPFALVVR